MIDAIIVRITSTSAISGPVLFWVSLSLMILFISYCKYMKWKMNVYSPESLTLVPLFTSDSLSIFLYLKAIIRVRIPKISESKIIIVEVIRIS